VVDTIFGNVALTSGGGSENHCPPTGLGAPTGERVDQDQEPRLPRGLKRPPPDAPLTGDSPLHNPRQSVNG